jgi:acetylornithine deacetylase/succinyl-diaminopimelate desuccinylase-like protein
VKAIEYARSNQHRFLTELKEFLRIPSVSTQEKHGPDIERAAAWLREKLLSAGFPKAEVMPTPGHPVVYAEWLAAGPGAPTILIYGHYDVQPPDPLELWNTPPFEPTIIGDDIFARGAADDKGQLYIHVKAVEAFTETSETGVPPINIKAFFEGEEEIGSPSLEPFIRTHTDLLSADVAVISDTHMLGKDIPSITYALRGLAYFEIEVTGPDHDLHSGAYGGAVHNPINALCALIARLQDKDGRITIPGFYDKVRELDAAERAELARIPFERQPWLRETGAPADWGEPAYTIPERLSARPTLDVNGIWGGYIEPGSKTVLPSKAFAKISTRLVPDQDPVEISQLLKNYVAEIAPPTVDVKVRSLQSGEAAIVDRDSPAMRAACQAYAASFGKEPLFTRAGGSIPVVPVLQKTLGIETILMGFGLPDDRLHSPNEKFHLPNFYAGVETVIHFMASLGSSEKK